MAKRKNTIHKELPEDKSFQLLFHPKQGHHFDSVLINNYRCFHEFNISSCKRVNLIGGKNNVGKTSFLEALFLVLGATNMNLLLNINRFRGVEKYEGSPSQIQEALWNHLFYNYQDEATISIEVALATNKSISLNINRTQKPFSTFTPTSGSLITNQSTKIQDVDNQALQFKYKDEKNKISKVEVKVDGHNIIIPAPEKASLYPGIILPARYRSPIVETTSRFGQLAISNKEEDLVLALKKIEPRLQKLTTILGASGPMIYGDVGLERMVPLVYMGDGMVNLASILLAISSAPHGVVLIDEIENGLHYAVLDDVWNMIATESERYDVQVFATTHSWECIKSAHKVFQNSQDYDFGYFRFENIDDNIIAKSLSQETLQTTIDSGWEIR